MSYCKAISLYSCRFAAWLQKIGLFSIIWPKMAPNMDPGLWQVNVNILMVLNVFSIGGLSLNENLVLRDRAVYLFMQAQ